MIIFRRPLLALEQRAAFLCLCRARLSRVRIIFFLCSLWGIFLPLSSPAFDLTTLVQTSFTLRATAAMCGALGATRENLRNG